ncbi:MAG: tRNA (adenosine(37)-N6)-threonylcarbamoyltransferase complex ATPase subunit type 1 TsaE [Planctomycetaceae bacterium]
MNELRQVDIAGLQRLAKALVQTLPARVVIGLRGTLGAGKTRLVQAFAAEAGVDPATVTSPTFTLVQHYRGDRLMHHIDAYRLADEDEFIELGGEELVEDEATVLIEWPDRIAACLPKDILMIDIEVDDDPQTRTIRASCRDDSLTAAAAMAFAMAAEDAKQSGR